MSSMRSSDATYPTPSCKRQRHCSNDSVGSVSLGKNETLSVQCDNLPKPELDASMNYESSVTDLSKMQMEREMSYKQIFQKKLSPTDVGKNCWLVIPKKHAMDYFPAQSTMVKQCADNHEASDVHLKFVDKLMKDWSFRFIYTGRNFVFGKGWRKFVQGNALKPGDMITFYSCTSEGENKIFMIDFTRAGANEIKPQTKTVEKKGVKLFGVYVS